MIDWLPDKYYVKLQWWAKMGGKLDLEHPKSFNEKLQWLKIYNKDRQCVRMVDKATAKEYVAEIIGTEHIIPTLGIWARVEDIDFDSLPDKFVLKCTHDSGSVIVCTDKSTFDLGVAKKKLSECLKKNYYRYSREWPYKFVVPRILAETYLEDEIGSNKGLSDYKFFCFNGTPKLLYLSSELSNHDRARISFVELDWSMSPFSRKDYAPYKALPPKPDCFDDMLIICKKLCKGHDFVRVDLYAVGNRIYFSELTFYPCGGYMPFSTENQDKKMGDMLFLSDYKS